jgi:hypothetical protein
MSRLSISRVNWDLEPAEWVMGFGRQAVDDLLNGDALHD